MTEKRFTLCEGTINGLKSYYEYDGMPLTHLQVLTLFNKLCDKNKELSEENEWLKNILKYIIVQIEKNKNYSTIMFQINNNDYDYFRDLMLEL